MGPVYPWKDDSGVAASEKRDICRRSSDCKRPGQECQLHQDRRKINKGICMNEVTDCDTPADCQGGSGCCNGYCCEQRYYQQYKALPCITHLGCQDLGLGEYCCPDKQGNGTSTCCDTKPNPTPPTPPKNVTPLPPKNVTAGAPAMILSPSAAASDSTLGVRYTATQLKSCDLLQKLAC